MWERVDRLHPHLILDTVKSPKHDHPNTIWLLIRQAKLRYFGLTMNGSQAALRLTRVGRPPVASASIRFFAAGARLGRPAPATGGAAEALSPRWLSELRANVEKGLSTVSDPVKAGNARRVKQILDESWLELLVGSEGFVFGPGRRGLHNHKIVWGNMVGSQNTLAASVILVQLLT
jgi:hypothetical protein